MSRQIQEAVRIRRRGGTGSILNSKAEFSRCYIPRLVVEDDEEGEQVTRMLEEERRRKTEEMERAEMTWQESKHVEKDKQGRKRKIQNHKN